MDKKKNIVFHILKYIKGEQKKGSFQICFAFFAVCSLKITMLTLYIASSLNRSHLSPFWDYFWFYVSCNRGNKMVGLILGFRGSAPCGGVIFPQEINVYHALCIKILFNNTPGKPLWSNIKKNYWFWLITRGPMKKLHLWHFQYYGFSYRHYALLHSKQNWGVLRVRMKSLVSM